MSKSGRGYLDKFDIFGLFVDNGYFLWSNYAISPPYMVFVFTKKAFG